LDFKGRACRRTTLTSRPVGAGRSVSPTSVRLKGSQKKKKLLPGKSIFRRSSAGLPTCRTKAYRAARREAYGHFRGRGQVRARWGRQRTADEISSCPPTRDKLTTNTTFGSSADRHRKLHVRRNVGNCPAWRSSDLINPARLNRGAEDTSWKTEINPADAAAHRSGSAASGQCRPGAASRNRRPRCWQLFRRAPLQWSRGHGAGMSA